MRSVGILATCLALCVMTTACRPGLRRAEATSCGHVHSERKIRGQTLCEDAWICEVPPSGEHDRLGVRRLAPCGNLLGPVFLYLPDRHMTSEIFSMDARDDLRLYLAQAGIRTWSIDYRTHALRGTAEGARAADALWASGDIAADADWLLGFVRGVTPTPVIVSGFGDGATLAYELAARRPADVAALVVFDGARTLGDGARDAEEPDNTVPVLAFVAGGRGKVWTQRVRTGAEAVGGDEAIVRELPGFAHRDVLFSNRAARAVYEPTRRWAETVQATGGR